MNLQNIINGLYPNLQNKRQITEIILSDTKLTTNLNNHWIGQQIGGVIKTNPLDCNALDLTSFSNLERVEILSSPSPLRVLNVSGLANLKSLTCHGKELTNLNTYNCTNLVYLWANNNQLNTLNLGNCNNLIELHLFNNSITNLNFLNGVSETNLKWLDLGNNNIQITNIDVFQRHVALERLNIGTNIDCLKRTLTYADEKDEVGTWNEVWTKRNRFAGNFNSLRTLKQLGELNIENTDISDVTGISNLPLELRKTSNLPNFLKKHYQAGFKCLATEMKTSLTVAGCQAIENELKPFNFNLEAWWTEKVFPTL